MKYLWNPQRNSLKQQHLTFYARGFKSTEWLSAKKRQGVKCYWTVVRRYSIGHQRGDLFNIELWF
eukprot:1156918-Pelagomonas_calceolata.AAC.3